MSQYDDMIDLPHHVSSTHPQMSVWNRAAQFAPFAALTGYEDAIHETARLTDQRMELDENQKAQLDEKMMVLQEMIKGKLELPEDLSLKVKITYFLKDEKKDGGSYVETAGNIKKIDSYAQILIMKDGKHIPIHDVVDLDGELFYRFLQ